MKRTSSIFFLSASVLIAVSFHVSAEEISSLDSPDGVELPTGKVSGNKGPEIPERFLDDTQITERRNEELGINDFTAPSIKKIFEDLENLPPIPENTALRKRSEKLPIDRASLALEMGFLMGDGFIIVQCGKMNEVRPIALDLTRYAKAMGIGERINRHSASLLKNAEDGDLKSFKHNLALTQTDVEQELASLRDIDMAHLIALGGWIRALDAATAALLHKFSAEQASTLFQPDLPEYFAETINGVSPEMKERRDIAAIHSLLEKLSQSMALKPNQKPTLEMVQQLRGITDQLIKASVNGVAAQN